MNTHTHIPPSTREDFSITIPGSNINGESHGIYLGHGIFCKIQNYTIINNCTIDNLTFPKGVRLVLSLSGESHIELDELSVKLNAEKNSGAIFTLLKEEKGIKKFYQGTPHQELAILLDLDWMLQFGHFDKEFLTVLHKHIGETHLFIHYFQLTPMILYLANKLILLNTVERLSKKMEMELICWEIFLQLFNQLPIFQQTHLNYSHGQQRIVNLMKLLNSEQAHGLSLKEIAQACHSNVTTLQKDFQKYHHISIMKYLKQLRLERALYALHSGSTVAQAANCAGYKHIDRFSTAFKQEFGHSPSEIRKIIKARHLSDKSI